MNAHLDIFGIRPSATQAHANWPFDSPHQAYAPAAHHWFSKTAELARHTAVNSLRLAGASYLAPWLRAMQLSQGLGIRVIDDFWWSGDSVDCFVGFGSVGGHSFASWWAQWGFAHYGWAITPVQVHFPSRCKGSTGKPKVVVEFTLDAQRELDDLEFVLAQVRNLQPGLLSSSPMLWPSFRCDLSIAKINHYLSVYEAVTALPAGQKARMLTVGNQLCLVPRAIVKSTDLPKERAEKQRKMSKLTSQYFAKGQAIVQNAARGVFPSTVPVKKSG
jgi:hypothetical protein